MTDAAPARETTLVGEPAGEIGGVVPREVHAPRTRRACAEIFQAANARKDAVAVMGGATQLDLGAPPRRLDVVVSSRHLDQVIEYEPSDQIVHVEAGIPLAALQRVLEKKGQRLAIDPPAPARATIGGLLATNAFGPLRTRYGSLRDLLIGISIVRADGSVARGGGKVVKNVAGFDLPKLMVGALGTLGMIETATFRLHPLPEVETTLCVRGLSAEAARALVVRMRSDQLEPAAVVALGAGGRYDLFVRFEGFGAGVRAQRGGCTDAARTVQLSAEELPADDVRHHAADHEARRTATGACFKLSFLPATLARIDAEVLPLLTAALASPAVVLYPTLGLGFVTGDADGDADAISRALARGRAVLASSRGAIVVERCPPAMRGALDVWGPPPPAFALMKRVKERFDPDHRLNPGRFVGGL